MDELLEFLFMQVNKSTIRLEVHNGANHLVLPSYTLPDNVVMNGGLYERAEIDKHYKALENTLAPLGHPTVNGKFVSAQSPEAVTGPWHIGAWNRNVERRGNRIFMEKWVNIEFAANTAKGRELLQAVGYDTGTGTLVATDTPIHTSVACFTAKELTPNAAGYQWKAKISRMDHDAILIGVPGAATPEDGVGIMVNMANAVPLQVNAGVLSDNSYSNRQQQLSAAVALRFGEDAWVVDFDEAKTVVRLRGGENQAIGYRIEGSKALLADEGESVKRNESWVVNKLLQLLGMTVNSDPSISKPSPEAVKMDEAALAAMLEKQAETIAANTAKQLEPLQAQITELKTNNEALADQLKSKVDAEETEKRKVVAEKIPGGELAANALSGEALDAAYAACLGTTPAVGGVFQPNSATKPQGAPNPDDYFGKGVK